MAFATFYFPQDPRLQSIYIWAKHIHRSCILHSFPRLDQRTAHHIDFRITAVMESESVPDSYRRYKKGTAKLVDWLASTARSCRDISGVLPSIKGAKDALKRAKKLRGTAGNTAGDDTTVIVSAANLITLAQIVAKSNVLIPRSILLVAQEVISGRQSCAEWYASFARVDGQQRFGTEAGSEETRLDASNRSHQHFISVLQEVAALLRSAYEDRPADIARAPPRYGPREPKPDTLSAGLHGFFSGLEVEETSNTALGTEPTSQRQSASKITFELEEEEDQTPFAIWCFLNDMQDMRLAVVELWQEFIAGDFSYSAACFLTSIAHGIMRHTEKEFQTRFPELRTHLDLISKLGLDPDATNLPVAAHGPEGTQTVKDADQLLCRKPTQLLRSIQMMYTSFKRNETPCESKMALIDSTIHRIATILYNFVPVLAAMADTSRASLDTFTRGIIDMMIHPTSLPTWLVFACQMYFDISNLVGSASDFGHRMALPRIESDLETIKTVQARFGFEGKENDETPLRVAISVGTALMTEYVQDVIRAYCVRPGIVPLDDGQQDFCLQRALFMYPGRALWLSSMTMHKLGLEMGNIENVILVTAHLYKACVKAGLLTKPWDDMDFVIKINSRKSPFVWETKDGVDLVALAKMAKHFGMAVGVKRVAFNDGNRPKLPDRLHVTTNARSLEEHSVFLKTMGEKMTADSAKAGYWDDEIVLSALRCLASQSSKNGRTLSDSQSWYEMAAEKITPAQLLNSFKKDYISFEPEFNFDYVEFCKRCSEALNTAQMLCTPYLLANPPAFECDWQRSFSHFAYAVLWEAADAVKSRAPAPPTQLRILSAMLATVASKHGDSHVKKAREQSSGHLPPDKKPVFASRPYDMQKLTAALMGEKAMSETAERPAMTISRLKSCGDWSYPSPPWPES